MNERPSHNMIYLNNMHSHITKPPYKKKKTFINDMGDKISVQNSATVQFSSRIASSKL